MLFELVDRSTGKYKKSFLRTTHDSEKRLVLEHQTIQPKLSMNLGNKIITGSNNGEFGGELLLID